MRHRMSQAVDVMCEIEGLLRIGDCETLRRKGVPNARNASERAVKSARWGE